MATKKVNRIREDDDAFLVPAKEIIKEPLESEISNSFMAYALSVIRSRAIPRVEDGLLPVQRRVIYGMYHNKQTPQSPYVKSARVVGYTIGSLHPHGDSACYGSMARMAQSSSLRVPLIDGHGAFGDAGSAPASARYTEARLPQASMLLLDGISEDSVDMRDNYDGTMKEPVVLPAQFPNLLVNGSKAIAVGMATNIPPHNPVEVTKAARWLLTHPNMDVDTLMSRFVPGPDFPTGGVIVASENVREAYETGRGIIRLRGRYRIEDMGRGKVSVVFYELPYGISAESIIDGAQKQIELGHLNAVSDIKDLTDRHNGTRLVFESKAGFSGEALALELFSRTNLESSFGINMTVIANGEPRTISMLDALHLFLGHRRSVVRRRSIFRLDKRKARLHLIEGLNRVLLDIDAAIAIIRKSGDSTIAKDSLKKKFKLDEEQSQYVLELQLRRLTKFDSVALGEEQTKLKAEIAELTKIINDESVLLEVIGKELDAVIKYFENEGYSERLSTVTDGKLQEHIAAAKEAVASTKTEVADAPCVVSVLTSGNVIRSSDALKVTKRGKVDPVVSDVASTTRSRVVLVTNLGRGFRLDSMFVGEAKTSAKALGFDLKANERFVAVCKSESADGEAGLALGTKLGTVKVSVTDFPLRSDEFPLISLVEGDEVVAGQWVADASQTDFAFVSSDASLLRFDAEKVRPQGSKGAGVAGVKLAPGAHVLTFAVLKGAERELAEVVTFTGKSVKRSWFTEFPAKGRATGGVRAHTPRKGIGETADATWLRFASVAQGAIVVDGDGGIVDLPAIAKRDASGSPVPAGFNAKAFGRSG